MNLFVTSKIRAFAVICLLGAVLCTSHSEVSAVSKVQIKHLQAQATQLERTAQWGKACAVYARILEYRSNYPEIRSRYQFCLRRYFQVCRHSDPSYLKEVLSLDFSESLRLYEYLFNYLADHSLDPAKASPKRLFQTGVEELRHALSDAVFIKTHLSRLSKAKIRAFREWLNNWKESPIYSLSQALYSVEKIAIAARQKLKLRMTTTVMEFTCGSCYAVDEYTMYLTPGELRGLYSSIKGNSVGLGIKLAVKADKMIITEMAADSPAMMDITPPLSRDDHILGIDGKSTDKLLPEIAMDMLRGEPGTPVEIVVVSPTIGTRMITLERRVVFVPSVEYQVKNGIVGYISIRSFQESTVVELDDVLSVLSKSNVKALILDLRGNSGGLIDSAIEIARRFLPSGVIVTTQNYDSKQKMTFVSDNGNAITLPLVVLVDGHTASAAEILAGALKENERAKLVGQATFGKGCIQEVYSLSANVGFSYPGGLRMTVARFFSPNGAPYTGKGIEPHVSIDRASAADTQLDGALMEIERLLQELQ